MKRIISLFLSLAIVLSVFSFGIVSSASDDHLKKEYYPFDNSFKILLYVQFKGSRYNNNVDHCFISFSNFDDIEITQDSVEYIVEEFLPNCVEVNRYWNKIRSIFFERKFDEDVIASILSYFGNHGCNIYDFEISNSPIADLTPIVDVLEDFFTDQLKTFYVNCPTATCGVDDRLLTDFPNIETLALRRNDIVHLSNDSEIGMVFRDPINSERETFYVFIDKAIVTYLSTVCGLVDTISVREQYNKFLIDVQNDIVEDGFSVEEIQVKSCIDNLSCTDDVIAKVNLEYTCEGAILPCTCGFFDVKCIPYGDVNGDFYIDSFDVATTTEYVNSFEEPESAIVKTAMDVVADGYIDATDLAYVSYIANFEE